ncbi:hypothetical protein LR003_03970 [candidate division NPL-UPA2 bacterium]|nr:hypothetical protein [candidate division NPL-UPA2 bacterium]
MGSSAGKWDEALAYVSKGSTLDRYEPEPDDIMGFTRKEEKRLKGTGTLLGMIELSEKTDKLLLDLTTASAISRRLLERGTEADYWVVVKFGEHIGGERWDFITQLAGISIERRGATGILRSFTAIKAGQMT